MPQPAGHARHPGGDPQSHRRAPARRPRGPSANALHRSGHSGDAASLVVAHRAARGHAGHFRRRYLHETFFYFLLVFCFLIGVSNSETVVLFLPPPHRQVTTSKKAPWCSSTTTSSTSAPTTGSSRSASILPVSSATVKSSNRNTLSRSARGSGPAWATDWCSTSASSPWQRSSRTLTSHRPTSPTSTYPKPAWPYHPTPSPLSSHPSPRDLSETLSSGNNDASDANFLLLFFLSLSLSSFLFSFRFLFLVSSFCYFFAFFFV